MPEQETWKDIPGYEGYYQVSDLGRLRSLDRIRKHPSGKYYVYRGRILSGSTDGLGYTQFSLKDGEGIRTNRRLHQLVAETFIGKRPTGFDTCHNDGDPSNNTVENLRYDTRSSNIKDAVRHGTHGETRKTHCPQGHPLSGENLYTPPGKNRRVCRDCKNSAWRKHFANKQVEDQ